MPNTPSTDPPPDTRDIPAEEAPGTSGHRDDSPAPAALTPADVMALTALVGERAAGFYAPGSLAAAGILAALGQRRRERLWTRTYGRMPPVPTGEAALAEMALMIGADQAGSRLLDLGLRHLGKELAAKGRTPPTVYGAFLAPARVDLWIHPADEDVPAPWTAVDGGRVWRLDAREGSSLTEQAVAGTVAPYPGLVSIGTNGNGRVLVDLETARGLINLRGPRPVVAAAIAATAVELATSPWSDRTRLVLVGFGPEMAMMAPDRVIVAETLAEVLPEISASQGAAGAGRASQGTAGAGRASQGGGAPQGTARVGEASQGAAGAGRAPQGTAGGASQETAGAGGLSQGAAGAGQAAGEASQGAAGVGGVFQGTAGAGQAAGEALQGTAGVGGVSHGVAGAGHVPQGTAGGASQETAGGGGVFQGVAGGGRPSQGAASEGPGVSGTARAGRHRGGHEPPDGGWAEEPTPIYLISAVPPTPEEAAGLAEIARTATWPASGYLVAGDGVEGSAWTWELTEQGRAGIAALGFDVAGHLLPGWQYAQVAELFRTAVRGRMPPLPPIRTNDTVAAQIQPPATPADRPPPFPDPPRDSTGRPPSPPSPLPSRIDAFPPPQPSRPAAERPTPPSVTGADRPGFSPSGTAADRPGISLPGTEWQGFPLTGTGAERAGFPPSRTAGERPVFRPSAEVLLLGTVQVLTPRPLDEERVSICSELVVYLATHPEGVRPEVLGGVLWPRGVNPVIRDLTIAGAQEWLGKDGNGRYNLYVDVQGLLRLGPEVRVDWLVFRELLRMARHDPLSGAAALADALALVRGPLVAGHPAGRYLWLKVDPVGAEVVARVSDAAHQLCVLRMEEGDADGAIGAALTGLRVSEGDEVLWRDLLRAARATGDRGTLHLWVGTLRQRAAASQHWGRLVPQTEALIAQLLTPSPTQDRPTTR
ncbi:BTAD domain-containing putative transcriptional regulator [Sphaerisporangium corydalis]|uniref:BTAD domain-containing putative transcriptional regulator n=1 Tax=Sphaerisporangium corydalis TaxID=1441875 RepID=A0ABV9EAM4_9ACTN|nr:hypothetical protein [Sphaerisporangium corydalis]